MFVSASDFVKKTEKHGFKIGDFMQTMVKVTSDPVSLDVGKIQGHTPYMVYMTATREFSLQMIHKNFLSSVEKNDDIVVDAFKLLHHVSH